MAKKATKKKAPEKAAAEAPRTPCSQIKKYRAAYTPATTAHGHPTTHSGDDIAVLLTGSTPNEVMAVADTLLGLDVGTTEARYAHLNPGQARMCSGNQIRRVVRNGECTIDDVAAALASA